jgi:hypothetical protein
MNFVRGLLGACLCVWVLGCSLNEMAVDTTAGLFSDAEGGTRAYFDYESAGYAAPAGILQLEGLHTISADNEELSMTLAKAYMAYAYGWVMDAREVADLAGDVELAEHHRQRGYLMYTRAKDLMMRVANGRDEQLAQALQRDPKTLRTHLEKRWRDPSDDIPVLFWLMMTWNSSINNDTGMDSLVDLPIIRALAEYIARVNPGYEDAGALVFLGGFECSVPEQVGGNPKKGKQYFERALAMTHRKNHIHLLNYAQMCGVAAQDRALYVSLLREILEAPDQGSPHRLSNKVARRRAGRALARVEKFFY